MAENKVTPETTKASLTAMHNEAMSSLNRGCSALYDIQAAFERLEGFLAQSEDYGMEAILGALSGKIGTVLEDLERAETLFKPGTDNNPFPSTPGADIPDDNAVEMVNRILASKGDYADKLKGMVQTIHHGASLDSAEAEGGAQ